MSAIPFHVVIVGGGIGGLSLAQGLKKAGVSVAVYERDRTPTDRLQGYRIHIDPLGSRALHACLPPRLFEAFVATAGKSGGGYGFMTEQGEELLFVGAEETSDARDPVNSHKSVSRITLRRILLAGLEEMVHFDKEFVRYEEAPDGGIGAFFGDDTSVSGDVLVGADGGNSGVRKQLLPHAKRVDTGILAIAGKAVLTNELGTSLPANLFVGPASVMAPGGLGMFVAVHEFDHEPVSLGGDIGGSNDSGGLQAGLLFDNTQDYAMWAFTARREKYGFVRAPEGLDGFALQELVLRMTEGWHPRLRALVLESDLSTVTLLPIRSSVPVEHWETKNVTLLGDAIHSMTPMRGIGANVALRDAALLCENLTGAHRGQKPLLEAVRDYEVAMIGYGFDAVRSSMRAAKQATSENALALKIAKFAFKILNAIPPLKRAAFKSTGGG